MKKNELKAKMTQEDIQDLDSITEKDYIDLQKKFNSLLKMDEPNISSAMNKFNQGNKLRNMIKRLKK